MGNSKFQSRLRRLPHPLNQGGLPFELRRQRLDRTQRGRADVVLHAFHVVVDDLVIEAEELEEIGQELMAPGQVYEFAIRPFPTGNVFKKGHRIRLDVSSSNFPRFDVNPNTGEPLGQNRRMITANNIVYHSSARPSQVLLPIIPATAGTR